MCVTLTYTSWLLLWNSVCGLYADYDEHSKSDSDTACSIDTSHCWLWSCSFCEYFSLPSSDLPLVSCPDPALSRGKGSGDYWASSWLCRVNSLGFGQTNEIVPCHASVRINQWNRSYVLQACNQRSFKINTAESAQPINCSIVTRPFSLWEGRVWARD